MSIHTHIHYVDNAEQDFLTRGWLQEGSSFQRCISHALSLWFDRIVPTQNVTMRLNVVADRTIKRTAAGTHSLGRVAVQESDGKTVFEPSALAKVLTGSSDGEQRSGYDMIVYFNALIVEEQLWLDTDPSNAAPEVPPDKKDFVTMMTHELLHCLGIAGYRHIHGENFGQFTSSSRTLFDHLTHFEDDGKDGNIWFLGSETKKLTGSKLPLFSRGRSGFWAASNFFHIEEDTVESIINPVVPYGRRVDIQPIDWALLKDLGYKIEG